MSLTLLLLIIAVAGLAAALWVQARGFGLDAAAYRRRQRWAAGGLFGLLLGMGAVVWAHESRVVARLTAPAVDGMWGAVAIDGRRVDAREWRIGVRQGRVSGGRDGCNDWGYDEREDKPGERLIVSTLVGCPEDDPVRRAYWALASAHGPTLTEAEDGTLRIAARGHEGIFRRCRMIQEPPPPETSGRMPPVCRVD
ncbi:MAG TPA: hypothetical protein VF727_00255 [Allosphingosinicella sp.]|jgi:hypothetical protein